MVKMRDFRGNIIKVGDKFLYQFDTQYESAGELFDVGGVEVIKWEDTDEVISVKHFYYAQVDNLILKIINK
jgi:hypothetical protein